MSDLKFSRDGNCMLARDFMGLKLWDIRYESGPLATYPIHEHLKGKVGPEVYLTQASASQSCREAPCPQAWGICMCCSFEHAGGSPGLAAPMLACQPMMLLCRLMLLLGHP